MATKDKTPEERIQEAAEAGRIVYGSTDNIDDYDDIATEVLDVIFGLDASETFISDESSLSDFAGCCIPDGVSDELSLKECYALGRIEMVKMFIANFGITVDPYDLLTTVFEEIRQSRIKMRN